MAARRETKAQKIKAALQEMLGEEETVTRVWYEPINGPCMEMQGYAGGWYYETAEGRQDVLGYNIAEAMEMIRMMGESRKAETLARAT